MGADDPDFAAAQCGPARGVMDRLFALGEVGLIALFREDFPAAEVFPYLNDRLDSE